MAQRELIISLDALKQSEQDLIDSLFDETKPWPATMRVAHEVLNHARRAAELGETLVIRLPKKNTKEKAPPWVLYLDPRDEEMEFQEEEYKEAYLAYHGVPAPENDDG